jgi:hypothetical protein
MSTTRTEPEAGAAPAVDRRAFLGTAGALVAASVMPLSVVCGEERSARPSAELEPTERTDGGDESWHVDDMWGHRPRYAHPIPHAPPRSSPVMWERVEPIDYMLVI